MLKREEGLRMRGILARLDSVCHLRNPAFTGGGDVLETLAGALSSGRASAIAQAIVGAGRTSLAVEHVYQQRVQIDVGSWMQAEEPATLLWSEHGQELEGSL